MLISSKRKRGAEGSPAAVRDLFHAEHQSDDETPIIVLLKARMNNL